MDDGFRVGGVQSIGDLVDGANVGMIQCRGGLGLTLEASEHLRVACDVFGKELQRDETMEASILGLVDDSHTAATELLDDVVMRDGLADHGQDRNLGLPS